MAVTVFYNTSEVEWKILEILVGGSPYSSLKSRVGWNFRGIFNWLVVFSHPSEKYEFVNWDDYIPNINGKIKLMATKPPTSY